MATPQECNCYGECGYTKWRIERPYAGIAPLPEDGDCGISLEACQRLHPQIPITIDTYGPQTHRETVVAFPELPNENGRRPRRLPGGGHQ